MSLHDFSWQNANCVVVTDFRNHCQYWRPQEKIHKIRKNWTRVNIFNDLLSFWKFHILSVSLYHKKSRLFFISQLIFFLFTRILRLLQVIVVSLQCVWYCVHSHWRCYWPRGILCSSIKTKICKSIKLHDTLYNESYYLLISIFVEKILLKTSHNGIYIQVGGN